MRKILKIRRFTSWIVVLILSLGIIITGFAPVEAEGPSDDVRQDESVELSNATDDNQTLSLQQQPKVIEVVVPAIWYPVDPATSELIEGLNPKPTYPDMYPRSEAAVLNNDGIYEISMMGYPKLDPGQFEVNIFLYTANLWFTNKFHRIAAQGYRTYELDPKSTVKKVVYGEFSATESDGLAFNLNGMDTMPYQDGETMHLYIATRPTSLSTVVFKDEDIVVHNRMTSDEMKIALLDHVEQVKYVSMTSYREEELDLSSLDKLFIYDYSSGTEGAFILDGEEYKNFISSMNELSPGKYEAVFPIYWQENIPELLSAPEKFSRNRYKFDDTFHFTFTVESLIDVEITKTWVDGEDQDGKRPESVTIKLFADDVDTEKTLTLSEENNWSGAFTNLVEFEGERKIVYTIKEVDIENGYKSAITPGVESGFTVTNTRTPETVSVEGLTVWNDNEDQDGKRPESVTVNLLKNGTKVSSTTVSETEDWKWSFSNLDKFESGELNYYTIEQVEIGNGYTSTITGDSVAGFTVTNTRTPETVSVEGSKTWNDKENQEGNRPESIKINLLKNEVEVSSKIVTEKDDWKWSFGELPKYEKGKLISYTITEDEVEGYESAVSGYDVINKYIEVKPGGTTKPTDPPALPETGENSEPYLLLGFFLVTIGGLLLVVRKKSKVVK